MLGVIRKALSRSELSGLLSIRGDDTGGLATLNSAGGSPRRGLLALVFLAVEDLGGARSEAPGRLRPFPLLPKIGGSAGAPSTSFSQTAARGRGVPLISKRGVAPLGPRKPAGWTGKNS